MARIKNVSGEDRTLDGILVLDGQIVEVPDDDVEAYTGQENWALAPKKAAESDKKAAEPAEKKEK